MLLGATLPFILHSIPLLTTTLPFFHYSHLLLIAILPFILHFTLLFVTILPVILHSLILLVPFCHLILLHYADCCHFASCSSFHFTIPYLGFKFCFHTWTLTKNGHCIHLCTSFELSSKLASSTTSLHFSHKHFNRLQ